MVSNKVGESYLIGVIKQKSWFNRSPGSVQETIIKLPESFEGFLTELINVPEKSNGRYLWKIEYIFVGANKVLIGLIFKSELNNEETLVELVSAKEGSSLFSYGVLALRNEGQITHIGTIKKQNFLSNMSDYQPIQAFFPNFSSQHTFSLPETIKRELTKTFGREVTVSGFVDLGKVSPDLSMSLNRITLFVAIIDANVEEIKDNELIKFTPIEEINSFSKTTSNGILLMILAKLSSLDII